MVFGLPDRKRIGDDDAIRMEGPNGESSVKLMCFLPPNVGPRLYKSLVVQNVFLFLASEGWGLKLNTSNTCELNHPHEILGYL